MTSVAIEPLPTAGISKMLGLLELLDDKGGTDDVFRLSQDLHTPFAEVLLVLKGAEMLELCEVCRNQIQLTASGKALLTAHVDERKALLRRQMLKLKTFQHVVKLLENAKDHELAVDVILEQLAVLLPQEPPRQLFTTLLNWGRYGEVFGYSRETDTFFLQT